MNEEQQQQFDAALRKIDEMYDFFEKQKNGLVPMSDGERVLNGIGFIGRTTDTVATGALLVNTPEGPVKILRAA